MRTAPLLACLVLPSLLLACAKKAAPVAPAVALAPVAAPVKPALALSTDEKIDEILMQAVFGKLYRPASKDALADLRSPEGETGNGHYVVTAVAHTVLKTGETVLVANAEDAQDDGTANSSHGQPGLLNVFILRQTDGKWQVVKRHENVAALGSDGHFSNVEWIMLGKDKPGMAVYSGGTWQGYSVESVVLFDLGAAKLKALNGAGLQTHSDNEGGCDPEGAGKCWSVTGKLRMAEAMASADYGDALIDFSGEESAGKEDADGKLIGKRASKKISGAARYRYDGKQFKLVEGENLVPEV